MLHRFRTLDNESNQSREYIEKRSPVGHDKDHNILDFGEPQSQFIRKNIKDFPKYTTKDKKNGVTDNKKQLKMDREEVMAAKHKRRGDYNA